MVDFFFRAQDKEVNARFAGSHIYCLVTKKKIKKGVGHCVKATDVIPFAA